MKNSIFPNNPEMVGKFHGIILFFKIPTKNEKIGNNKKCGEGLKMGYITLFLIVYKFSLENYKIY